MSVSIVMTEVNWLQKELQRSVGVREVTNVFKSDAEGVLNSTLRI
ncbi:MAG: hypothetical protein QW290_07060 [Sulfolobales archaeon]